MASILNSTTQPLGSNSKFSGTYEKLGTNIESISVVIKSDKDGEVKIIFADSPSLPAIFTHTYSYDHTVEFHRVVSKKGLYIKVQYTNGAEAQTSFQMKTYFKNDFEVEQTTEGGNDVHITNESLAVLVENEFLGVVVEGMNFTPEGALIVSGGSSGGGDASASNQLLQIAEAETLNEKVVKCDTDNISGMVSVDNMVDVSALATQSTLEQLNTTAEDISLKLFIPQRSFAQVDFDTQSAQIVQGSGTWRVPLSGEDGWEYLNSTIGGASLYFYSNTPLTAGNFGLESDITLGSLTNMFFIGNFRALTANNPNRKFYLAVYTKPTGTNDYQPWYHSAKVWQLPNSVTTSKGVDSFYYSGLDISTIFQEYDHIPYELALQNGDCGAGEIIQFMALTVDSATPANNFDGIVKYAGYQSAGGTNRVIKFEHSSREKVATDNLRALTVSDGKLNVSLATLPAVSGEVSVSNFPETQQVSGVFWQETQPVSLATLPAISGVVSVQNVASTELAVKKPSATVFPLYTGAISGSISGSLDLDGYSSFDLLVSQSGGTVSSAGSVYIAISDDAVNWYVSSYSVYLYTDANPRTYTTTFPSLNTRYIGITGLNPFGGPTTSTTNSIIKVSAKK